MHKVTVMISDDEGENTVTVVVESDEPLARDEVKRRALLALYAVRNDAVEGRHRFVIN